MSKFNYLSLLLQIHYDFLAVLQTRIQQPWDHSYCIPSRWSNSGCNCEHRERSLLCTMSRPHSNSSESRQPLAPLRRGPAQTAGLSPGPHAPTRVHPWAPCKTNHLSQKPPLLDSRVLILYWKCIALTNVTTNKHFAKTQGCFFKTSLHQSFTSAILLLTSPWLWMEVQSTPLQPPACMTQLHRSLLPQSFTSFDPSQGITPSLCSSCRTATFLWSTSLNYPLSLIPARSIHCISTSTLLKCWQPFTALTLPPKLSLL